MIGIREYQLDIIIGIHMIPQFIIVINILITMEWSPERVLITIRIFTFSDNDRCSSCASLKKWRSPIYMEQRDLPWRDGESCPPARGVSHEDITILFSKKHGRPLWFYTGIYTVALKLKLVQPNICALSRNFEFSAIFFPIF